MISRACARIAIKAPARLGSARLSERAGGGDLNLARLTCLRAVGRARRAAPKRRRPGGQPFGAAAAAARRQRQHERRWPIARALIGHIGPPLRAGGRPPLARTLAARSRP